MGDIAQVLGVDVADTAQVLGVGVGDIAQVLGLSACTPHNLMKTFDGNPPTFLVSLT